MPGLFGEPDSHPVATGNRADRRAWKKAAADVIDRLYRRPPLSWTVEVNCWIAERLVIPWLAPLLRPWEIRAARRDLDLMREVRAQVTSFAVAARVGQAVEELTRRLATLEGTQLDGADAADAIGEAGDGR